MHWYYWPLWSPQLPRSRSLALQLSSYVYTLQRSQITIPLHCVNAACVRRAPSRQNSREPQLSTPQIACRTLSDTSLHDENGRWMPHGKNRRLPVMLQASRHSRLHAHDSARIPNVRCGDAYTTRHSTATPAITSPEQSRSSILISVSLQTKRRTHGRKLWPLQVSNSVCPWQWCLCVLLCCVNTFTSCERGSRVVW